MKDMKMLLPLALTLVASGTSAQPLKQDYQSCDLTAQHGLKGEVGGSNTDAGKAHISLRVNILQADIGSALKAGRLTRSQTDSLLARVEAVRQHTNRFVSKQGFLSAAERATYDRELDAVATPICRS